jgi:hypothetical protein
MASEDGDTPVHEGGCLCGEIRYRVVGPPMAVSICHCVNCQKNSGSAFSLNAIFPKGTLTVTGTPAEFLDQGDASTVVRTFCGKCGTPIESRSIYSKDGFAVIKAGTFDDPSVFTPDSEVYCKSALPWVVQGEDRKCFPGLGSLE